MRLRELYKELTESAPTIMQEIRMIEGILVAVGSSPAQQYGALTSPWDAIDLCLNLKGDWKLNKVQIIEEILNGGYLASKPKASRGLINDSLNYHIRKGVLSVKAGLVGRKK